MIIRLDKLPKNNSFFLFGARGTGKSTLIKVQFLDVNAKWIDLLDDEVLEHYLLRPTALKEEIYAIPEEKRPKWIIIDEVQKCPKLLNVAHQLIESKEKFLFALTGSSARKLKQKGVNLLAGRAWINNLYPITSLELKDQFNLDFILNWGGLPKIFQYNSDEDRAEYLKSYALTYIKQEIQEEQWVRKIEPFRKFLPIAAQMNGRPLNYATIARDVGVDPTTIKSYYSILEDTLLGHSLPAYHRSIRKQQRSAHKFYFFDLGIKKALEKKLTIPLFPKTSEYGHAFEHFIICEFYRLNEYFKSDYSLYYWASKDGLEVDLVIDRPGRPTLFIEIKSKDSVDERDTKHLESIFKTDPHNEYVLLSLDPVAKKIGNVLAIHWREFLVNLYAQHLS